MAFAQVTPGVPALAGKRLLRLSAGYFLVPALAMSAPAPAQAIFMRASGSLGFGTCVAAIGNLDRDGFSEVVITNPWDSSLRSFAGVVQVYSGRTGATLHTFRGLVDNAYLGGRVCALGDVDRDGVPDFAFSPLAIYPSPSGAVHVISGRTFQEIISVASTGWWSLLGDIDVDGDGTRDLIGADPRGSLHGANVFAYSVRRGQTLWSSPVGHPVHIGFDLRATPDRDGDGVMDVLASTGRGSLPTGATFLSGRTGQDLGGGVGGATALHGIASLPDLNGDGRPDFAVGGVYGTNSLVEVYSAVGPRLLYIPSPPGEVSFGHHLVPFQDFNRDGTPDILVASGEASTNRPRVHIVSGLDGTILRTLLDLSSLDYNAEPLVVTDLNNDGILDILAAEHPSGAVALSFVQGSYAHFGTGCRGTFGELSLRGQGVPELGQNFIVQLSNVAPLWGGVFYIGASDRQWGPIPLPLPLDPMGMPGCTLYVSGDLPMAWLPVSSVHYVTLAIPADPAVLHARFFNQAFQLDIRANPLGIAATNAGAGVVGGD